MHNVPQVRLFLFNGRVVLAQFILAADLGDPLLMEEGDPVGYEVMKRVGSDENMHQLFYRDLAAAAIEADPNTMMIAMKPFSNSSDMRCS